MWQSEITFSSSFSGLRLYIENKLSKIPKLSFVTRAGAGRTVVSLASDNYDEQEVKEKVIDALEGLFLVKLKLEFLLKELEIKELDHMLAIFLACVMNFRAKAEKKLLRNILSSEKTFSIDGILNFKMTKIKEKWLEICIFAEGLLTADLEEEDLINLIIFFLSASGEGETSVFITEGGGDIVVTNLTKGCLVGIDDVYPEADLNILNAVFLESPTEVLIENTFLNNKLLETVKRVVKVRVI